MKPHVTKAATAEPALEALDDLSAESAIEREIAKLGEWLAAQGLDPARDRPRADEGSRERLYWCFGYLGGLKQALAMLTSRGATLH